jgi:hypothetical protein
MPSRILNHLRGNAVGYVALFAALGGTSYAAVTLAPGSVKSRQLANGAVTHAKLARNSVQANNLLAHSLTGAAFKPGALAKALKVTNGSNGTNGKNGATGATGASGRDGAAGPSGPMGPAGHDGSASIALRARSTGSTTAPHGTSTTVPLTGASWTQAANDLDLITGSMVVSIPASCTGSFGNSLVISVDGTPVTFALAPTIPASTTQTVPFAVSELMEPGADTQHSIKAALANTCTKSGEDYSISNVKIDVVAFH